jgi:hypothetical protein
MAPIRIIAYPNRIATNRTCKRSPDPVKASKNVEGMICKRKSVVLWLAALFA